jgi:hypothetical protein
MPLFCYKKQVKLGLFCYIDRIKLLLHRSLFSPLHLPKVKNDVYFVTCVIKIST